MMRTLTRRIQQGLQVVGTIVRKPAQSLRLLRFMPLTSEGLGFTESMAAPDGCSPAEAPPESTNRLRRYFDAHIEGRVIMKWDQYFDVYDRHFRKFVGTDVCVLEVGVYGGGSLQMWREYFGAKCQIYGVDIDPACKKFEDNGTTIFTGDQSDRSFWASVRQQVPDIDILIDDGGHFPEQQITTLEEMLPHLRAGGVYVCEDVHGTWNPVSAYVHGLSLGLNAYIQAAQPDRCRATAFQQAVGSIHTYPFAIVVEKSATAIKEFRSLEAGSEWPEHPERG